MDMPMEEPRGNLFGGFLEMLFPPRLPEQEEEMMREREREEADLSPEDPEEAARKLREKDVVKTDSRFEQAHGQITQEGERAWEEVRMKYLDFGGFNYQKEVQAVIEKHRIPDPVDCVVDVAPWGQWENDCANSGMMVRARQRPVSTTPPRFGGKPCPPYSELPSSVEERPCDPVDAKWKWSDWRECGADGPSGIQVRTTVLIEEAKYGGKPYEYQKETRECTMPVVEEPTVVPEPTPVSFPMDEEEVGPSQPTKSIWEELTGWIDFGDGTITDTMPTPVQVDSGTNQDSLLPDQTTPIAPAETTPVVTEEPVQTTVVVEEDWTEDCPDVEVGSWESWSECVEAHRFRTKMVRSTTKEPNCEALVKDKVEQIMDGLKGAGMQTSYMGGYDENGFYTLYVSHIEECTPPAEEPVVEETVVVDSATTQDSSLPAQTSIPDTTSETPSPAEEPASGGGGGGQTTTSPAAITTETTEDEKTTTEEPEEESNALKIVGGLVVLSGVGYWAYQKYA